MEKKDYGVTLNLPKTNFQMKGNLPAKEPGFIAKWNENKIYEKSNISPVLAGLTIFSGILTIITPLVMHKITNFHFEILPFNFYIYLILLLVLYFTIVSIVKRIYIKKNHEWL